MKGSIPLLAATVFLSLGALAWAAEPERVPSLALPIQCEPGKTCWIVTHVDRDPSQGIRDYMCGRATYDGHKGVDFAVRDMRAVRKGVSVVATVSGVVVNRRDGMRDVPVSNKDAVKDRECGNGVYVRSPGGWSIKYCHMRRGSIAVDKGDKVKTGQHLGMVGLSGKTNFPHLHLEVLHGKKVIDPFTGPPPASRCGPGKHALWKPEVLAALPYRSVQLNNAGFAATRPKTSTAREGLLNESVLPRQAPVLFLWLDVFRSRPGDRLHMRILDPDGEPILDYDTDIKQAKAVEASDPDFAVAVTLTTAGGQALEGATRDHVGHRLAVRIDGFVVHTPKIREAITGGAIHVTKCSWRTAMSPDALARGYTAVLDAPYPDSLEYLGSRK